MGTYKEPDEIGTRLPDGQALNHTTGEVGKEKSPEHTEKDTLSGEESEPDDKDK